MKLRKIYHYASFSLLMLTLLFTCNVQAQLVNNISELKTAIANASPGDVIQLKNGTYNANFIFQITQSGTAQNPITIEAETHGMVTLTGEIEVQIFADYIRLLGFDFNGAKARTTPSTNTPYIINIIGDNNLLQDIRFKDIDNNGHAFVPRIYINTFTEGTNASKNNVISRCWFEKTNSNQVGMAVFGAANVVEQTNTTVEECYFKSIRPFDDVNGNSAVRFGGGRSDNLEPLGGNTIKNNLFDQYDGENEIISLKSSFNTITGNTFLNCVSHVNTRSYHDNTFSDNYFIGTDLNLASINTIGIWGENHIVENNYFHRVNSRSSEEGGAINLMAGDGTDMGSLHESVENITIRNNIIYESATISKKKDNHSIYLGNRYKPNKNRTILPKDITIENNYIFNSSDIPQIKYVLPGISGLIFNNNKVYKVVGDPTFPSINPNLVSETLNSYTIFKADNLGPRNTLPLKATNVGPLWLPNRETLSTKTFENVPNIQTFPNPFSNSLTLSNLKGNFKEVQFIDVSGKVLLTTPIAHEERVTLYPSFLSHKGLYFVKLISNNGAIVKKVIRK